MVPSYKKFFLIFSASFFSLFTTVTYGGDGGIVIIPKDIHNLTLENYIDAIDLSVEAGSIATLSAPNWREMEPSPQSYDLDKPLGGSVYALSHGMPISYMNIQIINTVKREVPNDLISKSWDDPEMVSRFGALISEIKKIHPTPRALSIGNEVDVYFDKHPDELDSYLKFLHLVRPLVRKSYPDLRIGVTVTFEGYFKNRTKIVKKIIEASDIVYFTYYPVFDMQAQPLSDIPLHLAEIVKAAHGKPIVLQEVGYVASEELGSSEILQAEFYKKILPLLKKSKDIEGFFIFALHDFSPPICESLLGYYGFSSGFSSKFSSFICTLGLRHSNGKPRLSYDIVKKIMNGKK